MEERFQLSKGSVVTHSLRHAGITALIEAGVSDRSVCAAAGLQSVDSLRPYHHGGRQLSSRLSQALMIPDDPDASDDEFDVDSLADDDEDGDDNDDDC
jgi:hypothetical protein